MKIGDSASFDSWFAEGASVTRSHLATVGLGSFSDTKVSLFHRFGARFRSNSPAMDRRRNSVRTLAAIEALYWHRRILDHLNKPDHLLVPLTVNFSRCMEAFHRAARRERSAGPTARVLLRLIERGLSASEAKKALKDEYAVDGVLIEYEHGRFLFTTDDGRTSRLKESAFGAAYSRLKKKMKR